MSEVLKPPNPLPLRFDKVKEKRDLLSEGIVLNPASRDELYDITNVAQSIITEPVLDDVMKNWQTPSLECLPETFCKVFCESYFSLIQENEIKSWDVVASSVISDKDIDLNHLTPLQAAVLTLESIPGYEDRAVSSQELFVELAMHAQQYETQLKKKLSHGYNTDIFYDLLRKNFPNFLKRLIALDSLIIDLYRTNSPEQNRSDPDRIIMYLGSELDSKLYDVDENNVFKIKPEYINGLKKFAQDSNFKEDSLGRTENRGCPFLVSNIKDSFIDFAIKEYISQHRKVYKNTTD